MAACSRCSGLMQYVPEKNMLKCPFCGNEEPLEQMINVENLNVTSGVLDADTMFENWLVTKDGRLERDFKYYYATDPRNEYFGEWKKASELEKSRKSIENYAKVIGKYLVGERFGKYRNSELENLEKYKQELQKQEELKKQKEREWEEKAIKYAKDKQKREAKESMFWVKVIIVIIAATIVLANLLYNKSEIIFSMGEAYGLAIFIVGVIVWLFYRRFH